MKCIDWTDVRWAVVKEDGSFDEEALLQALPGLRPEIIDGF